MSEGRTPKQYPELKKQSARTFRLLIVFIFAYLVLTVLSALLAVLCGFMGIAVIETIPHIIGILMGAGLIGMGILQLYFMIKFVFQSNKIDRSGMIEIFEQDQPKLFGLIRELTKSINTEFPKRVYVSHEVNASVFYDSSFKSMFIPVRKNLLIGLGLVNASTRSELKGVIAHELGHFSQGEMKVGSYVYYVNKVIHDLLFNNNSMQNVVNQAASASYFLYIFAWLGMKLIQGTQWVLTQFYEVINKSYMELSREMEFHADEIAVLNTGSAALGRSLLRIDLADYSLQTIIDFYNYQMKFDKLSRNIFPQHQFVMGNVASDDGISMANDLPQVKVTDLARVNRSSLVIKDQWASHPSTPERVQRMEALNIRLPDDHSGAWALFEDPEKIQEEVSAKFFSTGKYSESPVYLDMTGFEKDFEKHRSISAFDDRFNSFYNHYDFERTDVEKYLQERSTTAVHSMDGIFNAHARELHYLHLGTTRDVEQLQLIVDKQIKVRSFDYEGKRYSENEAMEVLTEVKKKHEAITSALGDLNAEAFYFFRSVAERRGQTEILMQQYEVYFKANESFKSDIEVLNNIVKNAQFLEQSLQKEEILPKLEFMLSFVKEMKTRLKILIENPKLEGEFDKENREKLEEFLGKKHVYFHGDSYDQNTLNLLQHAMNVFPHASGRNVFFAKKGLLDFQLSCIE